MTSLDAPILVTGASSQLGQRVIQHLLHSLHIPAQQIIATTHKLETWLSLQCSRDISLMYQ